MKKIAAVCAKQCKDTWRNKTVLFQFAMMPLLTVVMARLMPPEAFAGMNAMFCTMYVSMVPMSCMTSVLAEEREKGTLRCLRMAGVKGGEYLLGVGGCLLLQTLAGIAVFAVLEGRTGWPLVRFLAIAVTGGAASLLLGAIIGMAAKNQMAAGSIAAPVSVALSFLPLVSGLNEKLELVSELLYTHRLRVMLTQLSQPLDREALAVVTANLAALCLVFVLIYRKKGLKDQ